MADGGRNRFLFLDESGEAIHFYMPPCAERKRLKPIIEAGGGTISGKPEPDCIKLAVPGQTVKGDDLVLSKYVGDCVEGDELLDVVPYRIDPANPPEDDGEVVSDFETAEPPITKVHSKLKQGRQKYLLSEDMNIIKYILDEELYRETGGNKIWQDMEALRIVNHPWQSIRDRFLKQIVPNINSYQVTKYQKALLTNTFVTEEEAETPENKSRSPKKPNSSESRSPKKPYSSESRSPKKPYSSPAKKKFRKESGQETMPKILYKMKDDTKLISDVHVGFDNLDRELLAMACSDDDLPETKVVLSTVSSKDKQHAEKLEGEIQIINIETENQGNSERTTETEKEGETHEDAVVMEKKGEGEKPNSNENNMVSLVTESSGVNKPLCVTQPSDVAEPSHVTVSSSDLQTAGTSRDTLLKARNSVEEVSEERRNSPRKRRVVRETQHDAESTDEDSQSVISPRRSKRARVNGDVKRNGEGTSDSNNNNNNASTSAPEPTDRVSRRPHKAVRALKDFVCSPTASQPATMSLSPNNDEQEVMSPRKAEKIIKKTCRWLGMQEEELLSVLWMTSGGLKDAVTWILSGGSSTVPVWREEDDEKLDNEDVEPLHERFGTAAVGERLHFLAENRY